MKIYVVGGYVRDALMQLEPKDMDFVVVGSTPEEMILKGFKQVGADFPVFLDDKSREWALARTERKVGSGYHGFEVEFDPDVTLEEDLYRRDFTINAMAIEIINPFEKGKMGYSSKIIDPFNGRKDVEKGIIKHVSEHFNEDPVRALRAARFAARYGFTIASQTFDLIYSMKQSGELNHLTKERVWLEFEKAVEEKCVGSFLRTLKEMEILETVYPDVSTTDFYGLCRTLNKTDGLDETLTVITSYVYDPDKFLNNILIPTKTRHFAKKYHALMLKLYDASKQPTGEQIIETLNHLDVFRDRSFLSRAVRASCCFDTENMTNKIIDFCVYYDIARNIGYEHLTDEQKETLVGVEIGNAINSLRTQSINEVLTT